MLEGETRKKNQALRYNPLIDVLTLPIIDRDNKFKSVLHQAVKELDDDNVCAEYLILISSLIDRNHLGNLVGNLNDI